jgi:hypothetical protein
MKFVQSGKAGPSKCVISLGISDRPPPNHPARRRNFRPGLARISERLRATGFEGAFVNWEECYPEGCPSHTNVPFAFKPLCFRAAAQLGYDLILWLDASIWIKRPLDPLFALIAQTGYLLFKESHSLGEYCRDAALSTLGIGREESFDLPCCWACAVGLDMRDSRAQQFLHRWVNLALDGITFAGPKYSGIRGWPPTASNDTRVKGHRHDQTAASVVALKLGWTDWKSKQFFAEFFDNDRRWIESVPA